MSSSTEPTPGNGAPTTPPATIPAGGQLVPTTPTASGPPRVVSPIDHFFETVHAQWASFPTSTTAGKSLLMGALEGDSELLDKHIGQVIEVRDLVLHTREVVDDDEVKIALRGVLVLADGTCIGTWSSGALRCLREIMDPTMYGRPTWNPPLRLRVIQRGLANGMRTYRLIPEPEQGTPDPEPKKGGKVRG